MKKSIFLLLTMVILFGCGNNSPKVETENKEGSEKKVMELKAKIITNKGEINLTLFADKAPVTVASFVNLAERGYYKGIKFHRVIENFMIQTGCPLGNGTGGPGYNFEDEVNNGLVFDKPGLLAMANTGRPVTNGSQIFITHINTDWLNNKHTIFGEVVSAEDQNVVNLIEGNDVIENIEITGDYSELFEAQKSRIAEWNEILDVKFPKR